MDVGAVGMEFNDWRAAAASALDWWADAGVDVVVEDTTRDWLAAPVAEPPKPAAGAAPVADAPLPESWDAFLAWRGGAQAPDARLRGVAVQASGPARADIMVLADCPDQDDEAGKLLSGAAGRLFNQMLAAIGLTRAEVHLAAVCAKRPVAGRMPPELVDRLHDCTRHHVGLVAPKRLLLLGNAASRAILATDTARARGNLHPFAHKLGETGVVATHHPRLLLEQPARKADAWRDLQLLMRGLER